MSRAEARQLVRHGHFTLNGKKADIPSIIVKAGDVVKRGQVIACSDAFMSAPVHASISGTVKKIENRITI